MAGFNLGINGGDSGDSFMDAPRQSSGGGKSGSGEGLGGFFQALGIHVGESKAQSDAITKGNPSAAGPTGGSVSPNDTSGVSNQDVTTVKDSTGDTIATTPNTATVAPVAIPTINVPPPKENFLQKVLTGITGSQDQSSNSSGSPQVDGNKDGSFGGGLAKALGKMFGFGA